MIEDYNYVTNSIWAQNTGYPLIFVVVLRQDSLVAEADLQVTENDFKLLTILPPSLEHWIPEPKAA